MAYTQQQLTEIYDMYFPQIYGYFYYRLLSVEQAQDLAGDTFLALAEQINRSQQNSHSKSPKSTNQSGGESRAEIKNMRAFLYGIAYRKLQDHLRYKYKLPMADVELEDFAIVTEVDEFVHQQTTLTPEEKIMLVIDTLPPQQRQIIELRIYDKLSLAEICTRIDKPMAYVKTTQNRAVKNLRKALTGIPDTTTKVGDDDQDQDGRGDAGDENIDLLVIDTYPII